MSLGENDFSHFLSAKVAPISKEVTVGAVIGYLAGYIIRKTSSKVFEIICETFVALELISYYGKEYVQINWIKIEEDATKALDADRDGKFTSNDMKIMTKRFIDKISNRVPYYAGFGMAFFYSFKK